VSITFKATLSKQHKYMDKRRKLDNSLIAKKEKYKRSAELVIANEEKAEREAELVIANEEKAKRIAELVIAEEEKAKRVAELVIAEEEKAKRIAELVIAEEEKAKRIADLVIAEEEKAKRADELAIANEEKAKRVAELVIAEEEKAKRVAELVIADEEKAKRVAELVIADEEKAKRADELAIANEEKAKRIAELVIADEEKAKRIAELVIADEEKAKRADELAIANEEKAKRIAELVIADEEKAKRVTELVIAVNELQLSLQLNADKDLFISVLAHDLRSPFTALLGLSELLLENIRKYNCDEIETVVHHFKNSAQDTYTLLDSLLKWIRAQSGKIPFKPQNLSFAEICKDILKTLKINADLKNISVSISGVEGITVFADEDMLKTVMRNLVSNAIKFTNNGGAISIHTEENSGNIVISVSDNGIGIIPDKLTKLFDISQIQIKTTGTAEETGTGFGLLLCKEFIEKHSGKIWVESEAGKGSEFKFSLPIITYQDV
jgi:signal transduction histidine kinase